MFYVKKWKKISASENNLPNEEELKSLIKIKESEISYSKITTQWINCLFYW